MLSVLVLAAAYGKLNRGMVVKSLEGTLRVTVMVFFIILAFSILSFRVLRGDR